MTTATTTKDMVCAVCSEGKKKGSTLCVQCRAEDPEVHYYFRLADVDAEKLHNSFKDHQALSCFPVTQGRT